MLTYDELKGRLEEIAGLLKKFPESVQPQVYDLLIGKIATKDNEEHKPTTPRVNKESKVRSSGKSKDSYTLLKDLDLKGGKGKKPFKHFISEKKPASAIEFNAASVFYLSVVMELIPITPNHVYTCYSEAKRRSPDALGQSLRDTAGRRYGYIDIADDGTITIPLRGKNFVQHDLPKKENGK